MSGTAGMSGTTGVIGGRAIRVFQPSQDRMALLGARFETEYEGLLRFAYFVTGDRLSAEDLVQDAFVRMHRSPSQIGAEGFRAYARTTILNLARSGYRRRALERRHAPARATTVEQPDVAARDEVWSAILALSPRQRAVVALRFYEDLTERDIATALGMSVGAVKKHLHRATTKLREHLGRQS